MDDYGEDNVTSADDVPHHKKNLKWLGPAGVSLARLDQVKTNVYSVGLLDAKDLKVTSGSRFKSQRLQNPLNGGGDTAQLHRRPAWGSSGSLSALVERHNVNQKKRPESAKVYTPSRPLSGKKPRPHSAHDPTRRPAYPPYMTGLKDQVDPNVIKPFIAVKGAHYEPGERPPNIGPYHQSTAGSVAGIHGKDFDDTLQKVADCQDGAHGYSSGEEGNLPPPPPRTSPDLLEMINDAGDDSVVDEILYDSRTDDRIIQSKPPKHKQFRRPLPPNFHPPPPPPPQPIHLSLPQAAMEDVPEEAEIDTERLIGSASHHLNKGESTTVNLFQKEGFRYVHADVHVNSPKAEVNGGLFVSPRNDLEFDSINPDSELCFHIRNSSNIVDKENEADEENLFQQNRSNADILIDDFNDEHFDGDVFVGQNARSKSGVTFSEDQNITVDITPRNTSSRAVRSYNQSGRSDLRNVKSRVDSGIKLTYKPLTPQKSENNKFESRTVGMKSAARQKDTKVSTISIEFSDDSDSEDEVKVKSTSKKKTKKATPDVETMMSRISISDDENELPDNKQGKKETKNEKTAHFVGGSGSVNYYELMRQSQGDSEVPAQQKITTNTIVLHDRRAIVQKNVHLLEMPPQREASQIARPPSGLQRPMSAQKNAEKAAKGGDLTIDDHERPQSRMSFRTASPDDVADIAEQPKRVRPVSAPTYKPHVSKSHKTSKGSVKRRPTSAHVAANVDNKSRVFCHNSSHIDTNIQPSAIDAQRANAAVQAMKEGRLFEKRTNSANCFAGRRVEKIEEKPQKVIEIRHRKDDYDIDTEDMRECKELQHRLIENGVPVALETLARALLPPAPQSCYGDEEDMAKKLPKHNARLLSKPKTWLPDEFNRLVAARKAVRLATESLLQQDREARRAAGLLSTRKKKKKGKKGKMGKGKKGSAKTKTES